MFEKFYEKYAVEEQEVLALIQTIWGGGRYGRRLVHAGGDAGDGVLCRRQGRDQKRTAGMAGHAPGAGRRKGLEVFSGWADMPPEGPQAPRVCLKIHSRHLHAPLRGIFTPDSVSVARYASLIRAKSPTKWDAHLAESNFQTPSSCLCTDHVSPEEYNCWAVVKVLEPSAPCPCLEAVWEEYQRPVVIQDQRLGTLVLDRKFGQLEGRLRQNGREISLFLEIDQEDMETWDAARSIARRWTEDGGGWDKAMREFAAKELTGLANEWQEEDGAPITEEAFAGRIGLSELSFTWEGEFTAYYDDGGLFWGHAVEVCGSLEGGTERAEIVG